MELYEYLPENLEFDENTLNELKALTVNKLKRTKRKNTVKRLITIAASFVLVIALMWAVGFENVAAAAQRLFSFIPGFGITESEENIYILKETVTTENEKAKVTLYHASSVGYFDAESLYFHLVINYKDGYEPNSQKLMSGHGKIYYKDKVYGNEYSNIRGSYYNSVYQITGLRVDFPHNEIMVDEEYILEITVDETTVSIPFVLQDANRNENIEVVTQTSGSISVTAVKYREILEQEEYIAVDLQLKGDNNTGYKLPDPLPYVNTGVYFESENKKVVPKKNIGSTYYFDPRQVLEGDILKLSGIYCFENIEETSFTVKVPEEGEREKLKVEIPFNLGKFILKEAYASGGKLFIVVESEFYADIIHVNPRITRDAKDIVSPMNRDLNFTDSNFNEMSVNIKETDSEIIFNINSVHYTMNETFEFNFN